jgi:transcriptional regulator with XRE-family HTH domain
MSAVLNMNGRRPSFGKLDTGIPLYIPANSATSSWYAKAVSLVIGVGTTACIFSPKTIDPLDFFAYIGPGVAPVNELESPAQTQFEFATKAPAAAISDSIPQSVPEIFPVGPQALTDLGWIREHGNVSMSALAGMLGVTRKALYDWFSGSAPRDQRIRRIAAVRLVLESLPDRSSRASLLKSLDRQLSDGRTLREILRAESSDVELQQQVAYALRELAKDIADGTKRLSRRGHAGRAESEIRST